MHQLHSVTYCYNSPSRQYFPFPYLPFTFSYIFVLSSRMYRAKYSPSKKSGEGVAFFNHCHKAFLRPYGKAESAPDPHTIFNRINQRNCEWLCRPHVALSEFTDTLQTNLQIVEASTLIDADYLSPIVPKLAHFTGNLLPFERASDSTPTVNKSTSFLHALVEENELDSFFEKAFDLGGALLTTSLNYLVI